MRERDETPERALCRVFASEGGHPVGSAPPVRRMF